MDTGLEFDKEKFHFPNCLSCQNGLPVPGFDWSFIPIAVCISLKGANERVERATVEFHKVGLCRRLLFYRPTRDKIPARGCWESHRRIARQAKEVWQLKRLAIFEDDVCFDDAIRPANIEHVKQQIEMLPDDWKCFMLGHWALFALPKNAKVVRTVSLCTHAYIMNHPLMDWVQENDYDSISKTKLFKAAQKISPNLGIDVFYALLGHMYALYPMIAYQTGAATSFDKSKANLSTKLLSDPKYMKNNQHFIYILSIFSLLSPAGHYFGWLQDLMNRRSNC
jgi:hypothetical protein